MLVYIRQIGSQLGHQFLSLDLLIDFLLYIFKRLLLVGESDEFSGEAHVFNPGFGWLQISLEG